MDIPLVYIILDIMITLKENNKDTILPSKTLITYLKRIISLFNLSKESLEELIFDFNYSEELSSFIDDYNEYFEIDEDNNIVLEESTTIKELKDLVRNVECYYDNDFIIDTYNIMHNNVCFLELLGINVHGDKYDDISTLEEELERLYIDLSSYDLYGCDNKKVIDKIKLVKLLINIMYMNMDNNFSQVEYKNLLLHSKSDIDTFDNIEDIYLYCDPTFDIQRILDTPMDRAIFLKDEVYKYTISERINTNIKKRKKCFFLEDYSKLNFYLTYLKLMEEEIGKIRNVELKEELNISRYKLMYTLDSIYDLNNYKEYNEIININSDYDFIIPIVYFYIFEVLSYDDSMYYIGDKDDIMTYYFNIIKKLYIETYYKLTNNERVINRIKNSNFYGKNKISTRLLETIMPNSSNIKRIKRKNYI